jgi:hypothetical protein
MRVESKVHCLLLAAALLAVPGCLTLKPKPKKDQLRYTAITVHDPSIPFPQEGVYDWFPEMAPLPEGVPIDPQRLEVLLRDALERRFAERGFRRKPDEDLSFYVAYHLIVDERATDAALNANYKQPESSGRWLPGQRLGQTYPQGTLVLDVVCADDLCPRWRGSVSAAILPDLTEQERAKRLRAAVGALLVAFPP